MANNNKRKIQVKPADTVAKKPKYWCEYCHVEYKNYGAWDTRQARPIKSRLDEIPNHCIERNQLRCSISWQSKAFL